MQNALLNQPFRGRGRGRGRPYYNTPRVNSALAHPNLPLQGGRLYGRGRGRGRGGGQQRGRTPDPHRHRTPEHQRGAGPSSDQQRGGTSGHKRAAPFTDGRNPAANHYQQPRQYPEQRSPGPRLGVVMPVSGAPSDLTRFTYGPWGGRQLTVAEYRNLTANGPLCFDCGSSAHTKGHNKCPMYDPSKARAKQQPAHK
jgi:hypothetical protein